MNDTRQANCETCGSEFQARILSVLGQEVFRQKFCAKCMAIQEQNLTKHWAASQQAADPRDAAWNAICPLDFRTHEEGGITNTETLAERCGVLRDVIEWKADGKGMLIEGATGAGKTRAAWRRLRKFHEAGGSIRAMTSGGFGRQFADAAGKHVRMEWFNDLASADVVLIDDLGKSKWTAAVWGEFFEIIDSRGINWKPTILTTNETIDSLAAKAKALDHELWDPLLRRLREFTLIKA